MPGTPRPPTPPPPGGPSTPPPPPGPKQVTPLDPNSPAGLAAAESLSQALAEIQVAIWQRRRAMGRAA